MSHALSSFSGSANPKYGEDTVSSMSEKYIKYVRRKKCKKKKSTNLKYKA